jgi:hypothetical protein
MPLRLAGWLTQERRPWLYAAIGAFLGGVIVIRTIWGVPLWTPGPDIDQAWVSARAILHGQDPYAVVGPEHGNIYRLFYPLTFAIVALPLAPFPLDPARLLFVAGTAALLGFALGKHRPELWPAFLGLPFLIACRSAQWSLLLTSAMLLPLLGFVAAAKPTIGLAMLVGSRSRRAAVMLVAGCLAVGAISLLIDPAWPLKWRDALRTAQHLHPLIVHPGGWLMLLLLLCWRDADARLLLALSIVPITGPFYDILPAVLVARTWQQCALLSVCTLAAGMIGPWLAPNTADFAQLAWFNGHAVLWAGLMPAGALVLARDPRIGNLFRRVSAHRRVDSPR